eukprot:COSAG01_NODE_1138_length_11546_cov_11.035206_6_plen_157_part_00
MVPFYHPRIPSSHQTAPQAPHKVILRQIVPFCRPRDPVRCPGARLSPIQMQLLRNQVRHQAHHQAGETPKMHPSIPWLFFPHSTHHISQTAPHKVILRQIVPFYRPWDPVHCPGARLSPIQMQLLRNQVRHQAHHQAGESPPRARKRKTARQWKDL